MRRILIDSSLSSAAQSAGIPTVIGSLVATAIGIPLWKTGHEHAAIIVIIVGGAGVIVGGLWFLAVLLMIIYRPESLSYQVNEWFIDLPSYWMDRKQPIDTIEVTAEGFLVNDNVNAAAVKSFNARLFRRGLLVWRPVGYASLVRAVGNTDGFLDPESVEVNGGSRSNQIRAIWAYFDVPPNWSIEHLSEGRYRAQINVIPRAQRQARGTNYEFGLAGEVKARVASHQRLAERGLFKHMKE